MKFVPGFEQTTLQYYDKPDSIYYIWHPYLKSDGKRGNRVGAVANHFYLIEILARDSFNIYDEHLSIFRFIKTREGKNSVTGLMPDTTTAVVNKIFYDIDPPEDQDLYKWQRKKFEQLQEFRKNVPSRMYATGRGYLIIMDTLDDIGIKIAKEYQIKFNNKFNLGIDPHVPIAPLRVFKLPYTKNSKTNTWVLPVFDYNIYDEIFKIQRYDEITGRARWLDKVKLTIKELDDLLKMDIKL
jgi:hypothetical protein